MNTIYSQPTVLSHGSRALGLVFGMVLMLNALGQTRPKSPVTDSNQVFQLNQVTVTGAKGREGFSHLPAVWNGVNYSGKKTEVLTLDSLNANTAQDNPRQVLGRIPGSNYSETQGSGFPSNGVGFRGLNPTQSIETNTRQNGYNITADIYGYPESYYLPPMDAVERIEFVRGASAIAFGPQFGGVVNYVIKQAPANKPLEITADQTGGSYGLLSSFLSAGGTLGKWSYFSFIKASDNGGWRPNSAAQSYTGFGKLQFKPNDKWKIGIEYSFLQNLLQMPGGLTDAAFNQDAQQSLRTRNWMTSPWNVAALTASYQIGDNCSLTFQSANNYSSRNIVWRNEDGGPGSPDSINPVTMHYTPREILHENFKSTTNEVRLVDGYLLGGNRQLFDAGLRVFYGWMNRLEGGVGTTGTDANFSDSANYYDKNMAFTTLNIAPYIENTFRLNKRLAITPGLRLEYIHTAINGFVTTDDGSVLNLASQKDRMIGLAAIGVQYNTGDKSSIYMNLSQCYTPITYSQLYPLGLDTNARIDANLKDVTGYNFDLGWRGNLSHGISMDLGYFLMHYDNAIGFEDKVDAHGNTYAFETNVASAVHQGFESYVEWNKGLFNVFNALALDRAVYTSGIYNGNYCPYAPKAIERVGVTFTVPHFSTTLLWSYTSEQFTDANNTVQSWNALTGIIPAFSVADWSSTVKVKQCKFKFGVNNLFDARYFTFRAVEYPGPGIIPSAGRTIYAGFGVMF